MDNFRLDGTCEKMVVSKNGMSFEVYESMDGDLWFSSKSDHMIMDIDFCSDEAMEWGCFNTFYDLMKRIVGRYVLNEDDTSFIPYDDFVDLDNKMITWHSDGEVNNVLRLSLLENVVRVELEKSGDVSSNKKNLVRIRTNGSDYGSYYQEFELFFTELWRHKNIMGDKPIQKKKSIFDKFGRKLKVD